MIPLVWFLFAWLILIGLFALVTFLTVFMNLRYGLTGLGTFVTTGAFLIVVVVVLLASGGYLFTVDWTQSWNVLGSTPSLDL